MKMILVALSLVMMSSNVFAKNLTCKLDWRQDKDKLSETVQISDRDETVTFIDDHTMSPAYITISPQAKGLVRFYFDAGTGSMLVSSVGKEFYYMGFIGPTVSDDPKMKLIYLTLEVSCR